MLEKESMLRLILLHHCHPPLSGEGMKTLDVAMSSWKLSTAEWKGACFLEHEGELMSYFY